jgi:hypothetical protein
VPDAFGVGGGEGLHDVVHDEEDTVLRKFAARLLHFGAQTFAFQELHDEVGRLVFLEEIDDTHHMLLVKLRENLAFFEEAFQAALIVAERDGHDADRRFSHVAMNEIAGEELLDGDSATEGGVRGAIGDTEAAAPQQPVDAVFAAIEQSTHWQCVAPDGAQVHSAGGANRG